MPSKDLLLVTWFCVVLFWMNKITWKRLEKNGIVNEIQVSWRGQNCRLMLLLQIYFFNRLQQGLQIVNRGEGEEWTSQCIQLVWHRFLCFKRFFSFFFSSSFFLFQFNFQFQVSWMPGWGVKVARGGWNREQKLQLWFGLLIFFFFWNFNYWGQGNTIAFA